MEKKDIIFLEESIYYFVLYVFIIFALLLVIAMIHKYTSFDEPVQRIVIDPDDLKTGDILGVAYSNMAGAFVSSFSRSIWSHTGTVWVDPKSNITYVLEGAIYPNKMYQHAMRIPFDKWYSYNCKFILGLKKYNGPQIDCDEMIRQFERYEGKIKLESFSFSWGKYLYDHPYIKTKVGKSYTCYELTILLNQNIGIYKKEKLYCSYFPGHIMNGKIPCEDGCSYERTKRFFITPTANKLIQWEKKISRKAKDY